MTTTPMVAVSRELLEGCLKFVESVYEFRVVRDEGEGNQPFNVIDYYGMEDLQDRLRKVLE